MVRIERLWSHPVQQDWEKVIHKPLSKRCVAGDGYWDIRSVQQNWEGEKYFSSLDRNQVKKLDAGGWIEFLGKYARWKFGPRDHKNNSKKLFELSPDRLLEIRDQLFDFDKGDIEKGLAIMPVWGVAGRSGLLAVLFPEHFGTVDKFVCFSLKHLGPQILGRDISRVNPRSIALRFGRPLIEIMRMKAEELNEVFRIAGDKPRWTPRKVDMVLWACGHDPDLPPRKRPELPNPPPGLTNFS